MSNQNQNQSSFSLVNFMNATALKLFFVLGTPLIVSLIALTISGFWVSSVKRSINDSKKPEVVEKDIPPLEEPKEQPKDDKPSLEPVDPVQPPSVDEIPERDKQVINPYSLDFKYVQPYIIPDTVHPRSDAAKCWNTYQVVDCFDVYSHEEPAPPVKPFPRYDELHPNGQPPIVQNQPPSENKNRGSGRRNYRDDDCWWIGDRVVSEWDSMSLREPLVALAFIGAGAYLASKL